MEPNKLDMSLEDLAKANKPAGGAQRNRRRGGARPSGSSSGSGPARRAPAPAIPAAIPSSKILVSNLHFAVTETDLKDLFSTVGPVKKVSLSYDASGRSKGSAEVEFVRSSDATAAIKKYNSVALDGRPMRIEVVARANILHRISGATAPGNRLARGPGGAARNGRRRGGSSAGKPRREPKQKKSAEELDSEMDTYMGNADA